MFWNLERRLETRLRAMKFCKLMQLWEKLTFPGKFEALRYTMWASGPLRLCTALYRGQSRRIRRGHRRSWYRWRREGRSGAQPRAMDLKSKRNAPATLKPACVDGLLCPTRASH